MAFCANCGSQVQGAFCPNCGTAMAAGASATSSPGTAGSPIVTASSGLEAHIAAALCYTPLFFGLIACIIFLLVAPYNQNKFVRFSALQSLFLHLAIFLLSIVLGIVATVVMAIVHPLAILFVTMWPLLWLAVLVLMLFLMYKSFNNEKVNLPFISDLANKQA